MISLDPALLLSELHQLKSGMIHADICAANIERLVSAAERAVPMSLAERLIRGCRCRCTYDYDGRVVRQCDPCGAIEEVRRLG